MKSLKDSYFKVTLVRRYPNKSEVTDLAYFYYIEDAEKYAGEQLNIHNPNCPLYIQYTHLQSATVYITKQGFMYYVDTVQTDRGNSNA